MYNSVKETNIMEKIVLAYSGGHDTSVILHWLIEKGYDVVTFTGNLGQEDDFEALREKASRAGASAIYIEDVREEFITDFIFPAIRANAVYEGRYLLGTSLARPLIAKKQIEVAKKEGANIVSHGATGKGNDQVRFELTYYTLSPGIKIFAPWKDEEFLSKFEGRDELSAYAQEHGIPVRPKGKDWSLDSNLMHTSFESGEELEDPNRRPIENMFEKTVSPKDAPEKETIIEIEFVKGDAVKVHNLTDDMVKSTPLELFTYLNEVAGQNGIGRVDMVENRFVGIKSRGVYETPAGTLLHIAHRDLEGITMDREVMHLRDSLITKFSELVYYGFWYSPEMEVLRALFDKSQEHVTGKVRLALYRGNVMVIGRESEESLYDEAQSSMKVAGGYDPKDARGFIRINALRLINNTLREQRAAVEKS
jgi:argininosuccinate synthase